MHFDEILKSLGEFGFYQKRLYLLLCMPAITVGSFMMLVVVVLYTPEHRCKIPGLDNDTFAIQSNEHQLLINRTIPPSSDDTLVYEKCVLYQDANVIYDVSNRPTNATTIECDEWVFDQTVFYTTFTSKINLVCNESIKVTHAQMLFYLGVLVGNLLLGTLADIIGRKKTMCMALVFLLGTSVGLAWSPTYILFAILLFVIGTLCHGAFMCCCVISLEVVGPSARVYTGNIIQGFFGLGIVYLAGASYLFRDWRYVELACAIPCVFYLLYWCIIPESPRWLLSQGREDEAEVILRKAAEVNKAYLPAILFDEKTKTAPTSDGRIWHVFRSPVLLKRFLILCFNWMIVSMTYYGVSMNSGNMAGDFHFNFFLMALAEFPGYAIAILLLDKLGRKKSYCLFMCSSGVACISTIFTVLFGGPELQPLTVTLAFLGKVGASAAFGTIYVFTAELFPTVIRNAAMGTCSCVARVGGMLAPYIAKSGEMIGGKFGRAEPLVVFGALTIMAGLLCLLLPETLNKDLPETMEDGERFGTSRAKKSKAAFELEVPFIHNSKSV